VVKIKIVLTAGQFQQFQQTNHQKEPMKQRIQCSKHTSVIASHHRYTNNVQYWECRVNHDTNLEMMTVDWFGFNNEI